MNTRTPDSDPNSKFDFEIPDTSNERVQELVAEGLEEIGALNASELVERASIAPTFNIKELIIIAKLNVANKPLTLRDLLLIPVNMPENDSRLSMQSYESLVNILIGRGIIERRTDGKECYYVFSEVGALIYKMWVLVGDLMLKRTDGL